MHQQSENIDYLQKKKPSPIPMIPNINIQKNEILRNTFKKGERLSDSKLQSRDERH